MDEQEQKREWTVMHFGMTVIVALLGWLSLQMYNLHSEFDRFQATASNRLEILEQRNGRVKEVTHTEWNILVDQVRANERVLTRLEVLMDRVNKNLDRIHGSSLQ